MKKKTKNKKKKHRESGCENIVLSNNISEKLECIKILLGDKYSIFYEHDGEYSLKIYYNGKLIKHKICFNSEYFEMFLAGMIGMHYLITSVEVFKDV